MRFQHFDEAQSAVKALNAELRFVARFGECEFPAIASVRSEIKRGTRVYSLNGFLGTAACMVPTRCKVTHLTPKSELAAQAIRFLARNYREMHVREKGSITVTDPLFAKLVFLQNRLNGSKEN